MHTQIMRACEHGAYLLKNVQPLLSSLVREHTRTNPRVDRGRQKIIEHDLAKTNCEDNSASETDYREVVRTHSPAVCTASGP